MILRDMKGLRTLAQMPVRLEVERAIASLEAALRHSNTKSLHAAMLEASRVMDLVLAATAGAVA